MTIAELIKDLTEYAKDNEKGFNAEVRSYVGMSRQAAEQRLKESESDEYVFDDFLPISYIHETDGFVYVRATDIPEVEPLSNANPSYWHCGDMVEREEVFDIIDEYKVESEEKE